MAADPWADFPAAPSGALPSPPPDPFKVSNEGRSQAQEERDVRRENRDIRRDAREEKVFDATHNPDGTPKPAPKAPENIPAAAATGMQENLTTLGKVEAALAALEARPKSIGPGTGMLGDIFTQLNDPDGTETRAKIATLGAHKIHELSGAAVSLSEAPRFSPFVPTPQDTPAVAKSKLEQMRAEIRAAIKEADNYYSPANGYRTYTTPGMDAFRAVDAPVEPSGDDNTPPPPPLGASGNPNEMPPTPGMPTPPGSGPQPPKPPQDAAEAGNIPGGGSGGGEQIAQGDTKNVTSGVLSRIREEYLSRLAAGQSGEELVSFLESVGQTDPKVLNGARAQAEYHSRFPKVPLNTFQVNIDSRAPLSMTENIANTVADNPVGAFVLKGGDALTGYNLDSIAGVTGGSAGRTRLAMDELGERYPKASIGGELAGGVEASVLADKGLARWARMGGGLIRQTLGGAGYGGLAGAGASDTGADGQPATLWDRAKGAAGGALAAGGGSLAGAGLVAGGRAVLGPTTRAGIRALGRDENVAVNQVSRALTEDGVDVPAAAARLADAYQRGAPMTIADLGENSRELLASVGRQRGESRATTQRFVRERQAAQADRLMSSVRQSLGPTVNLREAGDEFIARAREQSGPLYRQAFDAPGAGAAYPRVEALLQRPSARRAMGSARRIAAEEGRDPTALGFELDPQGEVILTRVPSWETLHYIKMGLDDVIETYRDKVTNRLVLDNEGRAINTTKNRLLSVMDEYNGAYRDARALYAGPMTLRDAMNKGAGVLKMAPDDVAAQIRDMTPSEMEMYRLGARKAVVDLIETKGDYADKVNTLIGTPRKRAIMARVFGTRGGANRFHTTLQDEAAMQQTYQAAQGNSATAGRMAFDTTTGGENVAAASMDIARSASQGGAWAAGVNLVSRIMEAGRLGPGAVGDRARSEIADILTSSSPTELRDLSRSLTRARARERLAAREGRKAVRRYGALPGASAGATATAGIESQ